MAAAKTKKSSKQRAGKTTASAPRVSSTKEIPVNAHGFAPGTKVEVYPAHQVDVQRRENRPPVGDPVTTATVAKNGDLTVDSSKLEVGQYVVAAKVDKDPPGVTNRVANEDTWVYTTFGKVSDDQRQKFGEMTGLFGGKKK